MSSGDEGQAPLSEEIVTIPDPIIATPKVIHEGKYRLFEKPDGGLHLVYKRIDKEEEDHLEIPGMMVRLLSRAQEGNMSPMEFMREAMKLRKG
jgi:hypothetical protein